MRWRRPGAEIGRVSLQAGLEWCGAKVLLGKEQGARLISVEEACTRIHQALNNLASGAEVRSGEERRREVSDLFRQGRCLGVSHTRTWKSAQSLQALHSSHLHDLRARVESVFDALGVASYTGF